MAFEVGSFSFPLQVAAIANLRRANGGRTLSFLKKLFDPTPEPDFDFAAKGFVQVAVMKKQGRDEAFLRKLERTSAIKWFNEGCSEKQALSARWGGCLAIEDDLVLFGAAIRKGKEEATELGHLPDADIEAGKAIYRTIYQLAGDFATRCAWEADKTMYRRFLNHVKK